MQSLDSNSLDALVIGGGPAGATAALLLARAGWSVGVIEKKAFPRRKVCGEYLSATTLPLLRCLHLHEVFETEAGPPVRRVGLFASGAVLDADLPHPRSSPHGWGRALSRERLDTLLLQRTTSAGARVLQPCIPEALSRKGDRWLCQVRCLQSRRITHLESRMVIQAHGSWEPGHHPGLLARQEKRPGDLFGFKAHFRRSRLAHDLMPLLCFPGGYGGMVHTDDGRVSLSCCVRRDLLASLRGRNQSPGEGVLAHIMEHCRGAREALDGAMLDSPWLAAGPIRPGIRLRCRDGLFPVGNVAGEAHPVVAEGISMAMQGAWLLCRRLIGWRQARGGPRELQSLGADYAQEWRRRFAPRVHAASVIAHWAMRPTAVKLTLPFLTRFPSLLSWGARLSGKTTEVVTP